MIKKYYIAGLILISVSSSMDATSLRDTVERVLTTNPDVIAEQKNQEAYKKYVDEREGGYLPTIDLQSYLETSKEKNYYKDNTPDDSQKNDGYYASITLRQYIYDGGLTPSQVAQTKHEDRANTYRSHYAIENTVLKSIKAYDNLVKFDERLALSKKMIKIHEDNLTIAKEKEEISGEVLETYQVSSKLYFATDSYYDEQDSKDSALATYERFVGMKPKGKTCRPVIEESKIPKTLKSAIEMAVMQNPKILEQIEKIKVQREKIAQSDATFLPRINLEFKASIDQDLELDENGRQDTWYGRLNLDWNLFNGNKDHVTSQQERIFLQEQKKTLDEITNEIVEETKTLYSKYEKYKKRVDVLEKYVKANANIVEVYKDEFEAGTRTFVDILDAESELYSSTKSLINMEYTQLNNYYDLLFNLSILSDTILASNNQNCDNVPAHVIDYTPIKKEKKISSEMDDLISDKDSALIKKELGITK